MLSITTPEPWRFAYSNKFRVPVINVSGGVANSMSLAQLSRWCAQRFGTQEVASESGNRKFDVPWLVLDSARAASHWGWSPELKLEQILEEIAAHAQAHPDWLEISNSP